MFIVIVKIILRVRESSGSKYGFILTVKIKESEKFKGFGKGSCFRIRIL